MRQPRLPKLPDLFNGVFVPRIVLEDARLTAPARILFGCLDGLSKTEQGCFASTPYLSQIVGVKPRHIRNLLRQLESLGYITRATNLAGWRVISTVSANALETASQGAAPQCRGAALECRGGRHHSATYRIEDKLKQPPTPFKGGRRSFRMKKAKLEKGDYSRGF